MQPKALLEGCACKQECSKKCRCMSSEARGKQCARLTCKSCSCFKRVCDSLTENLRLSTAFQQLLDAMSDDDSSLSSDSDVNFF